MYPYIIAIVVALAIYAFVDYNESQKEKPMSTSNKIATLFFLLIVSIVIAYFASTTVNFNFGKSVSGVTGPSTGPTGGGGISPQLMREELNVGMPPF